MDTARLDDCVDAALAAIGEELSKPEALFLLGTGLGTLPGALTGEQRLLLHDLPGIPPAWRDVEVVAGKLAGLDVWLVEDDPGDLEFGEGGGPASPRWERAFPVWLAAASGAHLCVLTAAGGGLVDDLVPPALCVLSDHLNLSGSTPLEGLGGTRLGPLFPDQSLLLHQGLSARAIELAAQRGIPLTSRVAAGVAGPALSTPAERRWFRSAGAECFAQGLSAPLHACAHAGLATLALLAVTDAGDEPVRMAELVARAEACAPALEDLLLALREDLAAVARELEEEYS